MKKAILIMMMLVMMLCLCACGGGNDDAAVNDDSISSSQTTDTTGQQEQNSDTAGDTDSSADDGSEQQESSLWDIYYYVDDFNQPTEDGYICNSTYFIGTFCNSATTDSGLFVEVVVDEVDVAFFLYEYGSYLVKNSSSSYVDDYNITMRTADGTDHYLTGTLYCGGDRIYVDDDYIDDVIAALNQEGNAMTYFYIENAERPTTNYLFTVVS
ncbi:MAG: hypothetical protein IJO80_04595, partial [Firmicutes bacterium]|nr:hypothetical protein [Bacillota bacterium]